MSKAATAVDLLPSILEALRWQPDQVTESQADAVDFAALELAGVGATPDEIAARAARYRARDDLGTLTPRSLAKWWAELAHDDQHQHTPGDWSLGGDYERRRCTTCNAITDERPAE